MKIKFTVGVLVIIVLAVAVIALFRQSPLDRLLTVLKTVPHTPAPIPSESDQNDPSQQDKTATADNVITKLHARTREVSGSYADILFNRPGLVGSVYPGSLLWWDEARSGTFNPVGFSPRKPLKIIVHQASATAGGQPTASFETDGSGTSYADALAKLNITGLSTSIDSEETSARSLKESMLNLKMSAKYLTFGGVNGSFDESEQSRRSVQIVVLKQIFFSAGLDTGVLPDGGPLAFSAMNAKQAATIADHAAEYHNEPVYVSDVNYGRVVILMISSDADDSKLKATAHASINYFVSGNVNLSTEQQTILQQATVRCVMLGNTLDPSALTQVLKADASTVAQKVKQYFADTTCLKDPAHAFPVSFELRYARDNATAFVTDSTKYAYWKPYEQTIVGQPAVAHVAVKIPAPAAVQQGGSDMDVGHYGARIWLDYTVIPDAAGNGFAIDANMRVWQYSKSFAQAQDTRFFSTGHTVVPNVVPSGFTMKFNNADLTGNDRQDYSQQSGWNRIPFKSFGKATNVTVRYDKNGDQDNTITDAAFDLDIPYTVGDVTIPIP